MTFETLATAEDQGPADPSLLAAKESGEATHKFVSFFLGEKHYAVPAHSVAEVVESLTPTRLPDAPPALMGIAPLRGDILAIVETGVKSAPLRNTKQKTVVLRPNHSVDMPVAFNVDQLGQILKIGVNHIRSASEADPLAEFESTVDSERVLIIEPSRIQNLLSAPE